MGVPGENETYCQGSRYFAKNLPIPKPDEAINLDMVGDKQLHLPVEKFSLEFHPELVRYLWGRADELGLDAFDMTPQHAIYDDHVPLYEHAGIPSIDLNIFLILVGKMAKNNPSIKSNNPRAVMRSFIFKFKVFSLQFLSYQKT